MTRMHPAMRLKIKLNTFLQVGMGLSPPFANGLGLTICGSGRGGLELRARALRAQSIFFIICQIFSKVVLFLSNFLEI